MANLFNEHPTLTPAQSIISTLLYSPWKKLKKKYSFKSQYSSNGQKVGKNCEYYLEC